MPFLVDGDNLLGSWPGRRRNDAGRRGLSRLVLHTAGVIRRRILLVFDGPRPDFPPAHRDVRFSGGGRTADELIVQLLRTRANPREWTVITNDRSLGDRCRHLGARVERCDRFRRILRGPASEEKPAGAVDVGEWMSYFGLEPDDD